MDLLRSLPLGLYLEQPLTWLHHLDPRVKLAWLMSFLLAPVLANPLWRIALAAMLILLTFSALIPWRVWRQQMVWLLMLSSLIFILIAISPDGLSAWVPSKQASTPMTISPVGIRCGVLTFTAAE